MNQPEFKFCPKCNNGNGVNDAACDRCGFEWPQEEPEHKEWTEVAYILAFLGAFGGLWAFIGFWPATFIAVMQGAAMAYVEHWKAYSKEDDNEGAKS